MLVLSFSAFARIAAHPFVWPSAVLVVRQGQVERGSVVRVAVAVLEVLTVPEAAVLQEE